MKIKLLLTCLLSMTLFIANAQNSYSFANAKPNGLSSQAYWIKKEANVSMQTKSSSISDESGYYFNNAYAMSNGSGNYSVDPLKVWPNGATGSTPETFSQAEQFIPNTVNLTLDQVSFLGMAMDASATVTAAVVIQDKNQNYIAHEFVTVSSFNKYTATFSTPISLSDTFMVVVAPYSSTDSLSIGVTNDYTGSLPFNGNGFFVEYETANQSFVNAFTPGNGGGDFIIWPSVTYTFDDVTTTSTCLPSTGQTASFVSPNKGLITSPIWNFNSWAIAQGAPVSGGYYHTTFEVVEETYNDTNQFVNFDYIFSNAGYFTVNHTERHHPWTTTSNVDQANTFNVSVMDVSNTSFTNATCAGCTDGSASVTATGGMAPYTYLWDDSNAQTTATATGLAAGTYTVEVTDFYGCSSISIVIVVENNSAEINGLSNTNTVVYPNPANKFVVFDIENATQISIVDVLGRTVLNKIIESASNIDISSLKNGSYFYKVILSNNKVVKGKFIVKK